MAFLSSPLRIQPPISPYRAPSPTMSPGKRYGRITGSDEGHLRDLSPVTTLRAFVERPMPYDTELDEYKIFACIESLTPAECELGVRVSKAAQRLRSWCTEIEQWGWTGSFEPPSEHVIRARRKSLEAHVLEHTKDAAAVQNIEPLEYWGPLLKNEVEAHEARLDEISEELVQLDVDELKEHVLDIHGTKSRPSSAGYGATRHNYTPMDDFSFLITQTLLSALPHHFLLKERLNTWTARVLVLREAPGYLDNLKTAQKAMRLAWEAIEPPTNLSDETFDKWKVDVETITKVLHESISKPGQTLDRMLDLLEGHDDCLPEAWIDEFEGIEGDFGKWAHESRAKVMDFDLWRKTDNKTSRPPERNSTHPDDGPTLHFPHQPKAGLIANNIEIPIVSQNVDSGFTTSNKQTIADTPTTKQRTASLVLDESWVGPESAKEQALDDETVFEEGDTVVHNEVSDSEGSPDILRAQQDSSHISKNPVVVAISEAPSAQDPLKRPHTPRSRSNSTNSITSELSFSSSPPGALDDSPSVRTTTNRQAKAPRPALNAAMSKRRPAQNGSPIEEIPPWPPTQFSKQISRNDADDLDRKISDILNTIPTNIRLTTGPEPNAPEVKSAKGLFKKSSRGLLRPARSIHGMKSPELTLSPAKPSFDSASAASGRRSAAATRGDNDIKLYHLTQPGKEHPIKLFIRRVGENGERVMVRVGGGWADLGEYLRQYAEHHGRRTVSDGKFEILGLEVKGVDQSPRPESAMSPRRDRRFSGGSPSTTPQKSVGLGILKDVSSANVDSTPAAANVDSSAPSTTSSRHSWTGNEVGLAGPKSKKLDLSNEKQEWIEGMLKQARTVSGNLAAGSRSEHTPQHQGDREDSRSGSSMSTKRPESRSSTKRPESRGGARRPEFGDLGKVGGTKRVFLRGGSAYEH